VSRLTGRLLLTGSLIPGSMLLPGSQSQEYAPPGESNYSNLLSANGFDNFGLIPGRSILPGSRLAGSMLLLGSRSLGGAYSGRTIFVPSTKKSAVRKIKTAALFFATKSRILFYLLDLPEIYIKL